MQLHRIIDVTGVSVRLFALGLDTAEIAEALSMRESEVCEALDIAATAGTEAAEAADLVAGANRAQQAFGGCGDDI